MKLTSFLRLAVLATSLASSCMVVTASTAHAAPTPKKIAIMSAISDEINVVNFRPRVSSFKPNERYSWPVPLGPFNTAALLAADDAIRQADPASSTVLLDIPDLAKQKPMLNKQTFQPSSEIQATLAEHGTTHVLLISKHQSTFQFTNPPGYVSFGTLEGLGFFVDNNYVPLDRPGDTYTSGFIAAHAFFKLSLIDLASSQVKKERIIKANQTYFPQPESKPWHAISDQKKLESLLELIKTEIGRNLPELLH